MERRRFITTALASSVFLVTQALAKEPAKGPKPKPGKKPVPAKRHPHPTEHEWHNWGADPYAKHDPMNWSKIDKFFEDAKKTGMPDDVAEALKQRIRNEPNGTITYITPSVKGQPDTIIPMMESGHGPMYHYPVARFQIAYGIVKAAEVRAWAVTDHTGTTYEVGYPLICGNWSVLKVTRCGCAVQGPPPPPQAQCAYIMIEMHPGSVLHATLAAPYDLPWTECGPALKVFGSDEYIPTRDARFQKPCGDWGLNCSFDAPLSVLSDRIRALGFAERSGYRFNYQATHHEWVILRLPPIVTENDKLYYYVFCLTENAQLQTRAIPVGSHEYAQFEKGKTAFITYGEAPPPTWHGHFQFWQFVPR